MTRYHDLNRGKTALGFDFDHVATNRGQSRALYIQHSNKNIALLPKQHINPFDEQYQSLPVLASIIATSSSQQR